MKSQFEHLGYFKEYYVNNVFYGSVNIEQIDRDVIGYCGRKFEILDQDMVFKKGRIKAGMQVATIVYPLCGKKL